MDQSTHSKIVSFIWGIADDVNVSVGWSDDLDDVVLAQLRMPARTHNGQPPKPEGLYEPASIQTAILQLLMTRLWEASPEKQEGDKRQVFLASKTLLDMGGVADIVRTYFNTKIELLVATTSGLLPMFALIFEELVTLRGRRQMRTREEIASAGHERGASSDLLTAALNELLSARILTTESTSIGTL